MNLPKAMSVREFESLKNQKEKSIRDFIEKINISLSKFKKIIDIPSGISEEDLDIVIRHFQSSGWFVFKGTSLRFFETRKEFAHYNQGNFDGKN